MEDFMSTVVQNGFSVAVAAFLLIRMERRLEELSLAIRELHEAIRAGNPALYLKEKRG